MRKETSFCLLCKKDTLLSPRHHKVARFELIAYVCTHFTQIIISSSKPKFGLEEKVHYG
jgi:hypothetical protein